MAGDIPGACSCFLAVPTAILLLVLSLLLCSPCAAHGQQTHGVSRQPVDSLRERGSSIHNHRRLADTEEDATGDGGWQSGAPRRRVALCFFGLTRSLTHTHPSIQKNLIQTMEDAGYAVDVFLHTYNLSRISNNWSNEKGIVLNTTEWQLLNPLDSSTTLQEDFLQRRGGDIESCKAAGHGWQFVQQSDFSIARNLLCQLNSIWEVSRLWLKRHEQTPYYAVIYARPDVVFNCPIPLRYLENLQDHTIVVPDHSHYNGVNDRFALAAPSVAALYGRRVDFALELCPYLAIHAERYMQRWAQTQQYVVVKMSRFDFFRVRANRLVASADALALRGCDMDQMHAFPIARSYAAVILKERRIKFREFQGWSLFA